MFHVSIWNSSPSGHPRCSIGDISKKDDRTGESFVNMFGPIEDMEDEKTSEEITFPTIKLAAKRSAERRRHERDTKLLQRLGATCRVAGDKAECKHKFPKTLHCLDLGAMASDDVILSGPELKIFFGKHLTLRVEEKWTVEMWESVLQSVTKRRSQCFDFRKELITFLQLPNLNFEVSICGLKKMHVLCEHYCVCP